MHQYCTNDFSRLLDGLRQSGRVRQQPQDGQIAIRALLLRELQDAPPPGGRIVRRVEMLVLVVRARGAADLTQPVDRVGEARVPAALETLRAAAREKIDDACQERRLP